MEEFILLSEVEEAEKEARKKKKARNRAIGLVNDAKARHIKQKTRARSKKAAMEKDAVLNSDRFKVLKDYERFEDIQDSYGWGLIAEAERDRLEELWKEREQIRSNTEDGIYQDLVTEVLDMACNYILEIWHDEIYDAEQLRKRFEKQVKQAEEECQAIKQKEELVYKNIMKGGL